MSQFATPSPSKLSRYSRYGSWQVLSEASFTRGLVTDSSPVAIPAGGVIEDTLDFLFDRPGRARKRGGTAYVGPALGTATGTVHVAAPQFSAAAKLIAVTSGPAGFQVWDVNPNNPNPAGATLVGATGSTQVSQPPILFNDDLYILGGATSLNLSPMLVSCSPAGVCSVANSASAPGGTVGCVHNGYLVLANNTTTLQNRLWFSPQPDPETAWDFANAYIDTAGPITGLASIQGVLLVFHAGTVERILGSIPPGTPGENMSLQPLSGQAGCIDPGAIVNLVGNVYFADANGAWVTNGASVTSLTSRPDGSGISSFWRQHVGEWEWLQSLFPVGAGVALRAGRYTNDYLMLTLLVISSGVTHWTTIFFLVYHIPTGVWARFTMPTAIGHFAPSNTLIETYASTPSAGRLLALRDLFADFAPTGGQAPVNSRDADGTIILPKITSRVIGSGPFLKAYGDGHITYRSYGYNQSTSSSVAHAQQFFLFNNRELRGGEGPNFASYLASTETSSNPVRTRFPISGDGHGYSFYLEQLAESSITELYAVEIEQRPYDPQSDL